jgi:murein DD-endopeptidase MepM/ murein hydrolase activator NlpD
MNALFAFTHNRRDAMWLIQILLVTIILQPCDAGDERVIPLQYSSPFGSYPALLTVPDHRSFHPVIHFPLQCWNVPEGEAKEERIFQCPATDFNNSNPKVTNIPAKQLATMEEFSLLRQQYESSVLRKSIKSVWRWINAKFIWIIPTVDHFIHHRIRRRSTKTYIGKYDEDRIGLYTSELFLVEKDADTSSPSANPDSAAACQFRTLHVGIDLAGLVGAPVYAFTNGVIHALGYNPELGDYGNVIVIQHFWNSSNTALTNTTTTVYALYGHLDDGSILNQKEGDVIRPGQRIGAIGSVYENGGWYIPHVHFQLSLLPPETHDMPGAVCVEDRSEALMQYVDPRYVLGSLH